MLICSVVGCHNPAEYIWKEDENLYCFSHYSIIRSQVTAQSVRRDGKLNWNRRPKMGKTTIEWTATYRDDGTIVPGYTFNPWWGCVKVSEGCKNCYAERDSNRWGFDIWGPQAGRRFFGEAHWHKPLTWNRKAEALGEQHRVFCASMCDLFEIHPDTGVNRKMDQERERLWGLIEGTPNLIWMLLTKRPENVTGIWPWDVVDLPSNVWLGTSIESNGIYGYGRVFDLLSVHPRPSVLFLSIEPLIGPVDIGLTAAKLIDWVIVGGESGPNARPMHPDWARKLLSDCQRAKVPFFFKQWGEWQPVDQSDNMVPGNTREHVWPDGTISLRIGRKNAGRLLDGKEWSQYPDVS